MNAKGKDVSNIVATWLRIGLTVLAMLVAAITSTLAVNYKAKENTKDILALQKDVSDNICPRVRALEHAIVKLEATTDDIKYMRNQMEKRWKDD